MVKGTNILAILGLLLMAGCSLPGEPDVDYGKTGVDVSSQLRLQADRVVPGMQSTHVTFAAGSNHVDGAAAASLLPLVEMGVQSVHIVAPARDTLHGDRELVLRRFLRGHGIQGAIITTSQDNTLEANTYRVEFITMDVIQPDCPNWSSSASTSYSNMPWSQLGCANVSNIGAMVADPHDLMQGGGEVRPDATRDSVVIQQYRTNKDWTPAATGGGATASGTQFGGGGGGGATSGSGQSAGGGGN